MLKIRALFLVLLLAELYLAATIHKRQLTNDNGISFYEVIQNGITYLVDVVTGVWYSASNWVLSYGFSWLTALGVFGK